MAREQVTTRKGMLRAGGPQRLVTATPSTGDFVPPASVTGFHTLSGSTSPGIVWVNPTGDFTGTLILRRQGSTAPTLTDGVSTRVADVAAPGTAWIDSGLVADTTYVYAAFAHDARPNFAPPAIWTFTTDADEVGGLRPYWGSSAEAPNYAESVVVYEQMFDWVGEPGEVRRLFTGSFSTSMTQIDAEIAAGRIPHWSTKGGTPAQWLTLAGLLAARDTEIFVTWQHEPENDYQNPAIFKQDFADFYDVIKANAGPKVHTGPILMRDTWVNVNKDPMDWITPGKLDFVGVDGYNSLGRVSFETLMSGPLLTAETLGKPVIVGELGTHGYPPGATNALGSPEATVYRFRWMEEATEWLETDPRAARIIVVQWFSSMEGMRAGPSGWAIQRSLNPMVIQPNPEGTNTAYGTVVTEFVTAARLGTHMAKARRDLNWYDGTATPANITNLTASLTTTDVQLSWTNPAGSDGTFIRRSTGATPPTFSTGTLLSDEAAGDTSYLDTGRTPGTQYSYSLFAHNAADIPSARRTITVTMPSTADEIPPGPVGPITLAGLGEDFVGFTWTNPADLDYAGADIYQNSVLIDDVPAPGYAYIATGLTPFTDYLFEVVAKDATGNEAAPISFFARTDKTGAGITRPMWGLAPEGGGLTTESVTLFTDMQTKAGQTLEGMKVVSTTFSTAPAALTREATAGRITFYCTRSSTPANYAALAAFCDGLGIEMFVTMEQEPELSPTVTDAADFVQKFEAFYDAFEPYPDLHAGPCLLRSTFAPSSQYAPVEDWFPPKMDFIAVNMFSQGNSTPTELLSLPMQVASGLGKPLIVSEVSVKGNPDERSEWLRQFSVLGEQPEYFGLKACYWAHTGIGAGAQPGGWYLDRAMPYTPPGWILQDTSIPVDPLANQRGALTLGTANYTLPNNTVYVSLSGNDATGTGGSTSPVRTIGRAVTLAGSNGTVAFYAGTYRDPYYWLSPNIVNITFVNVPNNAVWFSGSDVVTTWEAADGFWRKTGWGQFDHVEHDTDTVDEVNFPLAAWPYQVWYDTTRMTHVGTKGELGPGKFWVEENTSTVGGQPRSTIWIGSTPTSHNVEVAARTKALTINSAATVKGLGFKNYATISRSELGAVSVITSGTTWENCHFNHNSAAGLFIQQATSNYVRYCTFDGNGQMGLRGFHAAGTQIIQNEFKWNNWKRFATIGAAGGLKLDTGSHDCLVYRNWVHDNWGHAIWFDIISNNTQFIQNLSHNNLSSGMFSEGSSGAIFAGNVIWGSTHGIIMSGSANCRVWNNTIGNCANPVLFQTWDAFYPNNETCEIFNNIIAQDTPPLPAYAIHVADPADNLETAADLNVTANFNAVWRRSTTNNNYARVPNGSGGTTTYATLAAVQAAQTWGDNDIERTGGTVDPFVIQNGSFTPTDLVKTAGTAIPGDISALFVGWTDAQKADAPIGAVPDPALA